MDAPSQQQSVKLGNDNVAILMQGVHCFTESNVPPISLVDNSAKSPDHHPLEGDGFTFSPTSPDYSSSGFSRSSSASMSTSTSRSTSSSRGASFLENCSGGLDDCSNGGGGGEVQRSTSLRRYSQLSFISSTFIVSSCIFSSTRNISDDGDAMSSKPPPPRISLLRSLRVASTLSSKGAALTNLIFTISSSTYTSLRVRFLFFNNFHLSHPWYYCFRWFTICSFTFYRPNTWSVSFLYSLPFIAFLT